MVKVVATQELAETVKNSDSTILVTIAVIVFSALALIPVIKLVSTIMERKRKQEIEREDRLLEVIKNNTEVNTSIKTLLEHDRKNCEKCKEDQLKMIGELQDNQDIANMNLVRILEIVAGKKEKE